MRGNQRHARRRNGRGVRNALIALILLTTLDGREVWVESTQVSIVRQSLDCSHGQATAIMVQGKPLCVKESISEVRERVKKGNESPW